MCLHATSRKTPLAGGDIFYTMDCTARKQKKKKKKKQTSAILCFSCFSWEKKYHTFAPLVKLMAPVSCQIPDGPMKSMHCQCHWQSFTLQVPWIYHDWPEMERTRNVAAYCANNQKNSLSTVWAITHADFTDLQTTACTRTSLACIVQNGMQCLGPVLHSEMQMEQGWAWDAG